MARTRLLDRDRPPGWLRRRWPGRVPESPTFPSGRTAAAAAFAATLVCETSPRVSVPVAGLAAGVAYSRIYTGAHYVVARVMVAFGWFVSAGAIGF